MSRPVKISNVCIRVTFSDTQTSVEINHLLHTCESLLGVKIGHRISDLVDTTVRTMEIIFPVPVAKSRRPEEIDRVLLVIKTWCIARGTDCAFEVL